MSIAIIRRDIEREWENHCGVMGIIFLNGDSCSLSEELCTAKILERMRRYKIYFNIRLPLELLGANEQWSCGAGLTSRIALLVCFIVFGSALFWE